VDACRKNDLVFVKETQLIIDHNSVALHYMTSMNLPQNKFSNRQYSKQNTITKEETPLPWQSPGGSRMDEVQRMIFPKWSQC